MSDRREWARNTLAKLAVELGAWRPEDRVYQRALISIAADEKAVELVAEFGRMFSIMAYFAASARRDATEEAAARMMHTTATTMADQYCRPVSAKTIVVTREVFEKELSQPLTPTQRDFVNWFLENQAPLNDPIVEQRPPTRKELDADAGDYAHARAVRARVQEEGRRIFGKAGDLVTDAFVTAATGIWFARDDRRKRRTPV
jgi:hypothetical protein